MIWNNIKHITIMATIIYIIGIVIAVWCVLDIFKHDSLSTLWKIILTIAVLATSWLGAAIYSFIVRKKI